MTPKQFTGLAVAAAVSVAVATLFYQSRNRWTPGTASGEALMPALAARITEVAAVQILQGERTLTIEQPANAKLGDAWQIKERGGFPALTEKVRTLVVQLAQSKLAERKSQLQTRHATLELEDPVAKDAKSRMVRLLDAKGRAIGEVIVGKSRFEAFGNGKPGVYVRRPSEAQTWLAIGPIEAPSELRDWIDRKFFETDTAKIASLVWHAPGAPAKESLTIKRKAGAEKPAPDKPATDKPEGPPPVSSAGGLELEGVPAGKKLKGSESADNIARGFGRIEMDDVRKAQVPDKDAQAGKATLTTADGLTVTFDISKQGDAHWLSLLAAGEGAAKASADALNAKVQGWQYKLSPGTAGQLFKSSADLFETS